jgi:hypothetical protein
MATDELDPKREWREVKVRPLQGNTPRDRAGKPGYFCVVRRICDDAFPATPQLQRTNNGEAPRLRF